MDALTESEMLPYKIVDGSREQRFGVVACSLQDLVNRACEKLHLSGGVKVVLEQDGTEVDEEDYFSTLEKNTSLMVLPLDQRWAPPGRVRRSGSGRDQVDGGRGLEGLLTRLQTDIGHVSLLGGYELELLSDMDPDSLTDIVPDSLVGWCPPVMGNLKVCHRMWARIGNRYMFRIIYQSTSHRRTRHLATPRSLLDQLKEASGRLLNEKRQAQEAMDLLKLYHHHSGHEPAATKRKQVAQ